MKKRIFLLILLLPSLCFGADHYASPTGTATWANSTDIEQPCSIYTGFLNVSESNPLLLRGGVYPLSTKLYTVNPGSGDSDVNRVIVKNYPGETPVINSDGLENTIQVDDPYWTFDGLTINATNVFVGEGNGAGIFHVGYDFDASYTNIVNCTLALVSVTNFDNAAPIILKGFRASYTYIYNNYLSGSTEAGLETNAAVQALGIPGSTGVKILNNNISGGQYGIMIKHANADTSLSSGAEISNNYITDVTYGLYGQPTFMTIKNNLLEGGMLYGDNGGGSQGSGSLIDHNTTFGANGIELWDPSEGPISGYTITNNIFITKQTFGTTEAVNTWNYNMYADDVAIGANDLGNTSPTYTGGATPTNIEGYKLTSESAGYQSGSDSKDFGADVFLVGVDAGSTNPVVTLEADKQATSPTSYTGSFTVEAGRTGTLPVSSNGFVVTCDDGDCTDEETEAFTVSGVTVPITDTITVTDSSLEEGFDSITITLPTPAVTDINAGSLILNSAILK